MQTLSIKIAKKRANLSSYSQKLFTKKSKLLKGTFIYTTVLAHFLVLATLILNMFCNESSCLSLLYLELYFIQII